MNDDLEERLSALEAQAGDSAGVFDTFVIEWVDPESGEVVTTMRGGDSEP